MTQDYDDTDAMLNEMMARGREAQNSAFRSREDQVFQLGNDLIDLRGRKSCTEYSVAKRHILEAEARGAAEQRRKDAEGCEIVRQYLTSRNQWEDCSHDRIWAMAIESDATRRILYTRPANVAALEAEIESLKMTQTHSDGVRGEKQKRINALETKVKELETNQRKDQGVIHWLAEKLKQTDPEAKSDYELLARAALTREGEQA